MKMPTPEEVALFRVVPEVVSVLDYAKGFGHSDIVECKPTTDDLAPKVSHGDVVPRSARQVES